MTAMFRRLAIRSRSFVKRRASFAMFSSPSMTLYVGSMMTASKPMLRTSSIRLGAKASIPATYPRRFQTATFSIHSA